MSLFIGPIVSALLNWVGSFITDLLAKRAAQSQGIQIQHTADLEAAQKEAVDAKQIDQQVRSDSDAQLDAGLRAFQQPPASGHNP